MLAREYRDISYLVAERAFDTWAFRARWPHRGTQSSYCSNFTLLLILLQAQLAQLWRKSAAYYKCCHRREQTLSCMKRQNPPIRKICTLEKRYFCWHYSCVRNERKLYDTKNNWKWNSWPTRDAPRTSTEDTVLNYFMQLSKVLSVLRQHLCSRLWGQQQERHSTS